jgi:hypothetical protein
MQVGDLVKYVGRDDSVHYGIVIQLDPHHSSPVCALLQCADYGMWFQRRMLEVISASR